MLVLFPGKERRFLLLKIQILTPHPLHLILKNLKVLINLFLNCLKLKDLLENPIPCLSQKIGIQNLLLLICNLKKDFFKPSFLFLADKLYEWNRFTSALNY